MAYMECLGCVSPNVFTENPSASVHFFGDGPVGVPLRAGVLARWFLRWPELESFEESSNLFRNTKLLLLLLLLLLFSK